MFYPFSECLNLFYIKVSKCTYKYMVFSPNLYLPYVFDNIGLILLPFNLHMYSSPISISQTLYFCSKLQEKTQICLHNTGANIPQT